jgi:hypothetical protein
MPVFIRIGKIVLALYVMTLMIFVAGMLLLTI